VDGGDEEWSELFFAELPAEDWAAELRDRTVCWWAEPCTDQPDQLERT
jgi:hypothetical protein